MWPMQWQEPAVVPWCRGRGSCEWRRRRRKAAGWGRAQTDRTTRWWSTCPASPPGGPGRACPGSFLPQGTQCQRGSTCRRGENRMWETLFFIFHWLLIMFCLAALKPTKRMVVFTFSGQKKEKTKEHMSFSLQHQRHLIILIAFTIWPKVFRIYFVYFCLGLGCVPHCQLTTTLML